MTSVTNTDCESPEFRLLLLGARSRSEAVAQEIDLLVQEAIDWDLMVQLARWHGVSPLLYRSFHASPNIPAATIETLREDYEENARRTQSHTRELVALAAELRVAGIAAIPFKGPALAMAAYQEPEMRYFTNLDILVKREDVLKIAEVLVSRGYRAEKLSDVMPEDALLHLESKVGFRNSTTGMHVELHCQIVPRRYSYLVSVKELAERVQSVRFTDGELTTLSTEDAVIVLCLHAIKHGFWPGLKLVCDIAEIIGSGQAIDWKILKKRSARLGADRAVYLGLWLAHDLLGAKMPAKLMSEMEADPVVKVLAGSVRARLFNRERGFVNLVEATRVHFSLKKGIIFKARYLFCIATTPSERDFEFRGLRVSLSQSYFIRMLKFAQKFAGQIRKGFLTDGGTNLL